MRGDEHDCLFHHKAGNSATCIHILILTFDWLFWPRYQQQLVEHVKKCEEREEELVREGVARDLRLQSLQDTRDKLQADLQRKEEDMEQ